MKITRYTKDGEGNLSEDREFEFESGEVKSLENQSNVLSASIDFPSEDDTEDSSFSLNLGTEESINLQFTLYKEDVERSNGTHTSDVRTFEEIIPYLKRHIFKQDIGEVLYRVEVTTKFETIDAYYTLQDFSINTDQAIRPKGNIKLKFRYYNN